MQPLLSYYSPFTTALYVNATVESAPIPNLDKNTFACNISSGLNVGALYYPDMDDEHVTEVDDGMGGKVKLLRLFVVLLWVLILAEIPFFFHSANEAGVARVTCSVMDPRRWNAEICFGRY